jgi:mono/diheme cytochrome c family protein
MRLFGILALLGLALTACSGGTSSAADDSLPPGDAARGAALFTQTVNGAPACASCHTVDGSPLTAPSMQGFAARAGTRMDDTSAEDYAYMSITRPAAYVVSGFGNLMYNQYAQRLEPQQIADLIAYLLTL